MSKNDAIRTVGLAAGAIALCLAGTPAALTEEARGKPDFAKQSMSRAAGNSNGANRSSTQSHDAVPLSRAAAGPAIRAAAAGLRKDGETRSGERADHRSSKLNQNMSDLGTRAVRTPANKAPPAATTGKNRAGRMPPSEESRTADPGRLQPDIRSSATSAIAAARGTDRHDGARTAPQFASRTARHRPAEFETARAPKPPLRTPLPGSKPHQELVQRTAPEELSVRSAHAPAEHLSVRMTRGTFFDWLFGR